MKKLSRAIAAPVAVAVAAMCLLSPFVAHAAPSTLQGALNVMASGATGDGKSLDTAAIQSAIDQCAKNGGGTVRVPAGRYLVGTLILKSKVRLHLDEGATLLGSTRLKNYTLQTPAFESRTNGLYVKHSILYAENAEDIAVTGAGIIDGQGRDKAFARVRPQANRPYLARFVACRNLVIREVSMNEAANWTCHLLGCTGVVVDGLKIKNTARANRDGLDIDSCSDVTVTNCRIFSQDDAIVLKTTAPVPCRNITIRNCTVSSHASAIKIGTESTANFENITIEDCTIRNVPQLGGLSFMTVDGGIIKNLTARNITMENVNVPLMIRLGNRARPWKHGVDTPGIGMVQGVRISDLKATGAGLPCHITGLRQRRIEDIQISNISIQYRRGFKGHAMAYNGVPFKVSDYPGAKLYGGSLPASAFYVRDADKVSFDNIRVSFSEEDPRIPFVFDHVNAVKLVRSKIQGNSSAKALAYLRHVEGAQIGAATLPPSATCLTLAEKGNCAHLDVKQATSGLPPLENTPALPDKAYDNVRGVSEKTFPDGAIFRDLPCRALADGSQEFTLKARRGQSFKLMLLSANKNGKKSAERAVVSINGTPQRVQVDWENWGWALVNFQAVVGEEEIQKILIEAENGSSSALVLSKIVLIPVAVTD